MCTSNYASLSNKIYEWLPLAPGPKIAIETSFCFILVLVVGARAQQLFSRVGSTENHQRCLFFFSQKDLHPTSCLRGESTLPKQS